MGRTRWLMTIALGLAPMLGSMAMQRPVAGLHFGIGAASSSTPNAGAKSGGKSSSNSSSSNNNGSSSTGSSSSSSSSSSVSVGIAPRAKVTNPHGPIATPCANCHSYTSWKPIRSNPEFNHDLTGYPLRGMHQNVACTQCHTSMVFKNVSSQCSDCHADIHRRQFGANCSQCHSVKGWQVSLQALQNHSTSRFPLVGAHQLVQCEQCHKQAAAGQFAGLSTACYSCHQQDFLTPVLDHVGLKLPTDCTNCHSLDSWFNAKFDHLKYTGYALTGAHATLPCVACHINNVFKGTSAQCISCHQADFTNSNNPPHVKLGFPQDCGICHSTTDWTATQFDHARYAHYPLTGKHATVPCAQCHANNSYNNTPTDCYSCHQADFQGTTNPNHVTGGYPTDCSLCHTTAGWTGSTFDHNKTGFPLTGAHLTVGCAQCHKNDNYKLTSADAACINCHQTDYDNTNAPPHKALSSLFPTTCQNCHSTSNWSKATFDHSKTPFPLTGAHVTVACTQCHVNNNYSTSLGMDCSTCHMKDYDGTTKPNHAAAGYPTTCNTCHSTTSWITSSFNHSTTGFPLTGAHTTLQCAQCHKNNNFKLGSADAQCSACHMTDYDGTTNPNHVTAKYPTTCQVCHNTTNWLNATFDHNATGFPLTGAHATVQCAQCHKNNNYNLGTADAQCSACHMTDYDGTTNPNHVTAKYPTTCQVCHNTTSWLKSTFDHNSTGFSLTGAHTTVACASCHKNNNYNLGAADAQCSACHMTDYDGTTNPNHVTAKYPTTCQVCHNTTNWLNATFDHNSTGFPLTGAHTTVACTSCHKNNNYNLGAADAQCSACHMTDFQGTTNPNHVKSGFPTTCATCHNTTSWLNSTFDHNSTGFPLTGAHTTVQCAQCHKNDNYNLGTADSQCSACHMTDYDGTTNPNHVAAKYPTTCQVCHSTANWLNATFNHNNTGFPLTGAHTTVACTQCHKNNNYSLGATDAQCSACHMTDFQGTTNPNHVNSGFPTTCATCHNTTSWLNSTFNHNSTGFPLTGAHTTVQCAQCHKNNNYNLGTADTQCSACHMADYNGTTNPNHVSSGFPTTCQACHSTTNWLNATFNHNNTGFPLTGAHTTVQCAQCHKNNNYNLGTADAQCSACHMTDFQGTTNPNHVSSGFPTTCATCHNTTSWLNSTFNHNSTGFPLTGAHTTVQCAQCHVNNNYNLGTADTQCSACHMTDFQGTTNPNHVSSGFPTTCATCHNTTSWLNSTFNHNSTGFPLTGAHTTVQCAQCHVNNNYNLGATDAQCSACHMADYNGTTNPNHVSSGFPTTCQACHSTTNWLNATFNHNNTGFPLTGAHTTVQCAQCHVNNNYNLTSANALCSACHMTDFQGTTNPNHVSSGFPTTCDTCHSTTSWLNSTFNHNNTGFPLTGAHTTVQCVQCHVSNNYNLTSANALCSACHMTDYNGTTNPPHAASNFPTTCNTCHTTTNWLGATFNHASTGFALTGAHTTLQCTQCHVNNNYSLTSANALCSACHMTDYNGTTNPNHVTSGFPTTCDTCHSTANWTSATFNHNNTGFPLTGFHTTLQCAQCHVSNNYNLTSANTTCISCHLTDYNNTNNPPHAANPSSFPTTCQNCHTTTDWTGATFNHATTGFALTGAHTSVACASCHVNNNYSLPSTTNCWSCHQTDYNGTTNPAHLAAGFPQDCTMCHSTTNWTSSTFNHTSTGFALTGFHLNMQCAQCHVSNNYSLTSANALCSACHMTDYNGTTNPAHASAGFPTTCDTCHTTTDWTGATFNHNNTGFPLTGAHTSVACNLCHVNNNFNLTATACYGCHATDYNGTTNPNHSTAGWPTTCDTCHTTTAWLPATLPTSYHTFFPVNHGNANGVCTTCHNSPTSDYSVFTCTGCHGNNNAANFHHPNVTNYQYLSTACYSCHKNGGGG